MFFPFAKGLVIGAGMIIPLGAQNSYLLSQSIRKNYHFMAASICIFCDVLLMSLGVFGGGALIASNSVIAAIITWGGIAFLTVYGSMFFKNVYKNQYSVESNEHKQRSRKAVLFTTLAVTLLNPHVYLDTVMIIGAISGQFADTEKQMFLAGTITASFLWFYALSHAAAKLSPWLSQPKVQRVIDLLVALIMWGIAISLFLSVA